MSVDSSCIVSPQQSLISKSSRLRVFNVHNFLRPSLFLPARGDTARKHTCNHNLCTSCATNAVSCLRTQCRDTRRQASHHAPLNVAHAVPLLVQPLAPQCASVRPAQPAQRQWHLDPSKTPRLELRGHAQFSRTRSCYFRSVPHSLRGPAAFLGTAPRGFDITPIPALAIQTKGNQRKASSEAGSGRETLKPASARGRTRRILKKPLSPQAAPQLLAHSQYGVDRLHQ
eukprot:3934417-Rhodomonas_salina.1